VPLPQSLARFNTHVTNKISRPIAAHAPGFGVVVHHGRKSGTEYRTPVNVFTRPGGFTISLTYGKDSQWVRNVLAAGEADIVTRGDVHHVTNPHIVHDTTREHVPAPVRAVLGRLHVDDFLLVDDTAERGQNS
jgi:deazaflavin-dependent oxidoreductase (nitroreductase family)